MSKEWKLVPVELTEAMREAYEANSIAPIGPISKHGYRAMLDASPVPPAFGEVETVAVIDETDGVFPETVVEHRPGIDSLPVGTELVDRAHITRLQAELIALKSKLADAYEWGYGDGQNNPNGYSSETDRDKCVAELNETAKQEAK